MKIRNERCTLIVASKRKTSRHALWFSLVLVGQLGFWQPAGAQDFCQSNVPVTERINKPIDYKDFRSGWVAYGYSKESIQDAIQNKNTKQLTVHLLRLCQVTDGLKPFAENLDETDARQLQIGLNQIQGVLAAMDSASNSGDWSKFSQLEQQFSSVDDSIKNSVPPCWRAPIRDTGKRGKLNIARNIACR